MSCRCSRSSAALEGRCIGCLLVGLYRRRDTYRQKGKALLKEGKKSEAFDCFQKCVDVSPEMALAFIKVTYTLCTPRSFFVFLDPCMLVITVPPVSRRVVVLGLSALLPPMRLTPSWLTCRRRALWTWSLLKTPTCSLLDARE